MRMTIIIDGVVYQVSVEFGGYISGTSLTREGEAYVRAVIAAQDAARAIAVRDYLDIYNDSWVDDGHPALSAEDFARNLTVSLVEILDEPGFADIYFDDGDMFSGHTIAVAFTGTSPQTAQLIG